MKKHIHLSFILSILLICNLPSCSYLDIQDDFSSSDTKAFVLTDNPGQIRRFQRNIYKAMPDYSAYTSASPNGMQNPWVALSDEMCTNLNGNLKTTPVSGYTSASGNFHRWKALYQVIRQATIYIDSARVVGRLGEADFISETEMKQLKAEAYFFRAYSHYLLLEQYGPIPIMKTEADPSDPDADYARNTVDEVVDAIEEDIKLSMEGLDDTRLSDAYPSGFEENRLAIPTKGVALALKAKVRVLAASPLLNGKYTEALTLTNKDGKKIFPAYDAKKWEKAKEALEELLHYAEQGNYTLYKSENNDPHLNVYELFQHYNKEIIWANPNQSWKDVEIAQTPRDIQVTGGNSNGGYMGVTQEMVDAFFMDNGLKISDKDSGYRTDGKTEVKNPATTFKKKGKTIVLTDKDISNMYAHREPRFYAAITYQGKSWHDVVSNTKLQGNTPESSKATRVYFSKDIESSSNPLPGYGGIAGCHNQAGNYPSTGYLCYKFCNRNVHPTLPNGRRFVYRPSIIFRLADFYLLYAEVLNEIDPKHPKIAEYLDLVRERAGIPGYQKLQEEGKKIGIIGNQEAMRQAIRDERQVELFAEGYRYFDVRRWMIADKNEGRQGGEFHGMNMNGNEQDGSFYTLIPYNILPRKFSTNMYLYPIPFNQTSISNLLVQNPGWN